MRAIAAALLVVATLAAAWWNVRGSRLGAESRRLAVVVTAVLAASAVTVWTEVLGSLTELWSVPVLAVWLTTLALLVAAAARRRQRGSPDAAPSLSPAEWALVGGIAVVLGTVALIAVWAPPNTSDTMSYHLPRVMHWLQNRSLSPYPTNVPLQIKTPPGAEVLMANLVALAGNDELVTLVQWAAFAATALAVSIVAALLGGGRLAQILAAVVFTTLPMVIVQASGTKNDVVASLWIVSLAALVLVFRRRTTYGLAALIGLATGLALVTRTTAYMYTLPFFIWFAAAAARRSGPRRGCALVLLAGSAALLLNAPMYARNLDVFGTPLGPTYEQTSSGRFKSTNSVHGPVALASNAVRNAALQLASPLEGANRTVERAVARVHGLLGISENDERTTWAGTTFALPAWGLQRFEDEAPNTLAFLLGLATTLVYLARRKRFERAVLPYVAGIAGGTLLFCLVIRWEPWNSRFHTPLFALAAPFVGLALATAVDRRVAVALGAVLLLASVPWLLAGEPRSVVGSQSVFSVPRTDQYFANQPALQRSFLRAVDDLADRRCRQIGLLTDATTFEYPLWPLLRSRLGGSIEIEDVSVHNATASAASRAGWQPCAVLAERAPDNTLAVPLTLTVRGVAFAEVWSEQNTALFLPERS